MREFLPLFFLAGVYLLFEDFPLLGFWAFCYGFYRSVTYYRTRYHKIRREHIAALARRRYAS